jgi:alanyl-tRNA synthetase
MEPRKDYFAPMHTAEHILNATMVKQFNCKRSFSSHIEKKISKCDYHFDRDLTQNELQIIENKINAIIQESLMVTETIWLLQMHKINFL